MEDAVLKDYLFIAQLLTKVDQYEDIEKCWNMLNQPKIKYPKVTYKGKTYEAYRILHLLIFGPILKNMVRDHICENKRCINPHHLQVVTHQFNIARSTKKRVPKMVKRALLEAMKFEDMKKGD